MEVSTQHLAKPTRWFREKLTFEKQIQDFLPKREMDDRDIAFPQTPWSLILRIQKGDPELRRCALDEVCQAYWQPVYVFARMSGFGQHDAEDLTQDFFAGLERSGLWDRANAELGHLRALLIGAFRRLAIDHRRRGSALKRGGRAVMESLDWQKGEDAFLVPTNAGLSPDMAFDYAWARLVFQETLERIVEDFRSTGREALIRQLIPLLMHEQGETQRDAARRLGWSESRLKAQLHRIRKHFRATFRDRVAATVTHEDDLEEEIQFLLHLLKTNGGL